MNKIHYRKRNKAFKKAARKRQKRDFKSARHKKVGPLHPSTIDKVLNGVDTCYYCGYICTNYGEFKKTIDHKLPIARGGTNKIDNLVVACRKCNLEKGSKTEDEYYRYIFGK